jgi:hypothetical protein
MREACGELESRRFLLFGVQFLVRCHAKSCTGPSSSEFSWIVVIDAPPGFHHDGHINGGSQSCPQAIRVSAIKMPHPRCAVAPMERAKTRRRVRAFVDEGEISKVCLRQPARITADAVPGMPMDGIVEAITPAVVENPFANNASRQFRQVMILVSGDQQQTPIGLRVSVQFSPCASGQSGTGK